MNPRRFVLAFFSSTKLRLFLGHTPQILTSSRFRLFAPTIIHGLRKMPRPIALAASAMVAMQPISSPDRTANPSPKIAQKAGDVDQNTNGPIWINISWIWGA